MGSFRCFEFFGFRGDLGWLVALLLGGGLAVGEADEFAVGAEPGALVGGDLALDAGEEFGGGRIGEQGGDEGGVGGFGDDGAVEIALDGLEASLLPVGTEHGIDVEGLGGGLGVVLVEVVGGECFVASLMAAPIVCSMA